MNNLYKQISGKRFDQERALYNLNKIDVINCIFAGPLDGESVLKECRNIRVLDCKFSLRYPLWHAKKFILKGCLMNELTRAPLWYSNDGKIENCVIEGVKCLRECKNIQVDETKIVSSEFGWRCKDLKISNSTVDSVYFLLESKNVQIDNLKMQGKYSFQYTKNLHIINSNLDTKDAFWHSKNVIVENSIIKGEYLGWFSENLALINCKIVGTQPFCYCKNLRLVNCVMDQTDLAFEYSSVDADVIGEIVSVKNPKSGIILADSIGEIIQDGAVIKCNCHILLKENQISA